jgi:hypothetical protein
MSDFEPLSSDDTARAIGLPTVTPDDIARIDSALAAISPSIRLDELTAELGRQDAARQREDARDAAALRALAEIIRQSETEGDVFFEYSEGTGMYTVCRSGMRYALRAIRAATLTEAIEQACAAWRVSE